MKASLREIADRLGVSVATVSRALHRDPKVRAVTTERVHAELKKGGYQLDPVVSAGMSRIRQKSFYRETLAWCGDSPHESMPWLAPLFESVESYGTRLGYSVEYFRFDRGTPRELARLASIWRARGIRGVLLGPFRERHEDLRFPWKDLAWVSIGHALDKPVVHSVGRDYASDMQAALAWLEERGARRPCCLLDPRVNHLFKSPLTQAMLVHYDGKPRAPREPWHELDADKPGDFAAWIKRNRPDGLILPRSPRAPLWQLLTPLAGLPRVLLSPPDRTETRHDPHFGARYEVIGQASVNLLHRLVSNREFGLPAYKQTVALSSVFSENRATASS